LGRISSLPPLLLLALGVAGGACSSGDEEEKKTTVPVRTCGLRVWHKPASAEAHVQIIGDWDNWKNPGTIPVKREDGWRVAAVDVPPGEHAYGIVEDGVWLTDKNEPMTGAHDGREVTVATAPDCGRPLVRVDKVETAVDGHAKMQATFVSAQDGSKLAAIEAKGRDGSNTEMVVTAVDANKGTITFEATNLVRGKYTYTITAKDARGRDAEDARATVWIDSFSGQKEPWDPRDAIVYQVMLDRFRNDKGNGALPPPASPSARAGGNLAGVRKAIESGEIEALGASAIWLSPLYTNPQGEFAGNDGRPYTSYHGYWPINSRGLDGRFATEEELDAFMAAAHSRGIRVLFDVVPNHVHSEHPWAKDHSAWFKQDCVCGQGTCDWGGHIKTCWFAPYLPDLDWTNDEAAHAATDDVMWWFDRWDADGIRIDAVPMMPRAATRRIATAARRRYAHAGHALYVLGENFTGPGGYQSLRYDLGPYGLDGSFHFPLMWTLRESIALETAPLSSIDSSFRAGEEAWNGANAVMGLMIGNHDVSRFASVSAGNGDGDAWSAPPQPNDPVVYAKQRLALASVLTLPGAPVVYYGDEVGLAGRSDPDCRRVMPAEDALLEEQKATRDLARKIGKARTCSRPLRRGALKTLLADDEHFVFAREIDGESVIVSLSRRPTKAIDVVLPASSPTSITDVVTGRQLPSNEKLTIDPEPFGIHVWVADASGCAR
jgi:glycosidase